MKTKPSIPKVSILISVFNQLHCLDRALSSALNQDYSNIEIIIGDDFSTDGDVKVFVSEYKDHRIKYFKNPQNFGANLNYKTMLTEHASGTYAVVLNADDYWTDFSFISKAINLFSDHADMSLVFGEAVVFINSNDKFIEDRMNIDLPKIMDGNNFFINYYKGYSLPHFTCIYDRQKAVELNFYNNNIISSDWESLLKIVQGHKIGHIPTNVGVITRHSENYTKDTTLSHLQIADSYIYNLYQYAREQNHFENKTLDIWLNKMLKRHHIKWLIKLSFLDKNKLPDYRQFLKLERSTIYRSIQKDIRFLGFRILRNFPALMKWVFAKFLHQESFITDLIVHQTNRK